jgi:hypothetical protein
VAGAERVWTDTDLPVLSVVLWFQRHGKPPSTPFRIAAGNVPLGTWRFWGIELYKVEAETLFRPGLEGLLALLPFTHNGGDETHLERAAFTIYEHAPAEQKTDLEALLGTFGSRVVGQAVMRAILGRLPVSSDVFTTSPLYQEIVGEARADATRQNVLNILRQRFTPVPQEIEDAIGRAGIDVVQAVLDHAVTDSLDQMRERLGLESR